MRAWVLIALFVGACGLRAEDASLVEDAPTATTATAAPAKLRRWAVSTELLSLSPGLGLTQRGIAFEHAQRAHFSLVGVGTMDLHAYGFGHGYLGIGDGFDLKFGARWRPTELKRLDGFFLGLGLEKGFHADYLYDFNPETRYPYPGRRLSGFTLSQFLNGYAEIGWQWVQPSGLLSAVKLVLPLVDDLYVGTDPLIAEFSTLSLDIGFAW